MAPTSPPYYTGDAFDAARFQTFGVGRSKTFVDLWCVAKTYLKLFSKEPCYNYAVDALGETEHAEGPAVALKHILETAVFDFFHRSSHTHVHGNKDLAHHLFDRRNPDFATLDTSLLQPLGYSLIPEEWTEADALKAKIYDDCPGNPACGAAIDRFNAWLRRTLVLRRRHTHHGGALEQFSLTDERIEEEFHEVALEMATFLCLSEGDLNRLLAYQHQLEWKVRGEAIVMQILDMGADVLGLEEVDRIEDLKAKLAPHLQLAVYKHRKVRPYDDGCVLFYNPAVLRVRRLGQGEEKGDPAVGVVRYSGEAEVKQRQQQQLQQQNGSSSATELPLFRSRLPIRNGVVGCEEDKQKERHSPHEEEIDMWSFVAPELLRRAHQEKYDERVAVVALFEHIATGQSFVAACTHLAHTQDKPAAEALRAAQVRQLDRAVTEMLRTWLGKEEARAVPILIVMDGNDTPHLSTYGEHRQNGETHTPMYKAMTQELGYTDCLGEDYGPTSITLNRRFRIDYIWVKPAERIRLEGMEVTPAMEVRLAGQDNGDKILVSREEEEERALYGLPLPAIADQPCIPSDHLHVSARLQFRVCGEECEVEEQLEEEGGSRSKDL